MTTAFTVMIEARIAFAVQADATLAVAANKRNVDLTARSTPSVRVMRASAGVFAEPARTVHVSSVAATRAIMSFSPIAPNSRLTHRAAVSARFCRFSCLMSSMKMAVPENTKPSALLNSLPENILR